MINYQNLSIIYFQKKKKKNFFYKLVYELKQEEFLFYYDYIKRKGTGIWKIKNESKKNFYVIMITLQKEKFRNLESKKLKKKKKSIRKI